MVRRRVVEGISSDCLIARNLLHDNNESGGAAINLASVRNSLVRNNVVFGSLGAGIGMWDDGQGSQWGCKDNLVEHNTVVFNPGEGRFGINIWNGSTGNTVRNNIFLSGARGSISFTEDSLPGLDQGTDSGLDICYDGTPRPKGGGYDMGAYDN